MSLPITDFDKRDHSHANEITIRWPDQTQRTFACDVLDDIALLMHVSRPLVRIEIARKAIAARWREGVRCFCLPLDLFRCARAATKAALYPEHRAHWQYEHLNCRVPPVRVVRLLRP